MRRRGAYFYGAVLTTLADSKSPLLVSGQTNVDTGDI